MRLIKDLGARLINGKWIRFGIFECLSCLQEIEKRLGNGLKGKFCSSCRHCSEETKLKISKANKGKKKSEETRQKNSDATKGVKHPLFGKYYSDETKQKMREKALGRLHTEETKQKIREKVIGRKYTEEQNKRNSENKKGEKNAMYGVRRFGKDSPNWNNGSSFEPYSPEFNSELKQQILERDNYICQDPNCEHKSRKLHIHHIDYDKNNSLEGNLITLCNSCHSKTIGKNKRQQWAEFYQNIMINRLIDCLL